MSDRSHIEELLNGINVEWKPLGEIGEFIRGNGMQKKDLLESGFPAVHYGQLHTKFGLVAYDVFTYVSEELGEKLRKAEKNDLLLATTSENDEDVAKPVAWLGEEIAISGDMTIFKHNQNVKYLAYYFQTEEFQKQKRKFITGIKVRRISKDNLSKIVVPLPKLEIQNKIVMILDHFSSFAKDLENSLKHEITLRTKQFKFLRNQLFNFKENEAEWKNLGDVCFVASGGTPSKSKKSYWENGSIPWLKSESCNNTSVYEAKNFITELGLEKSSAKMLEKDTTLIALVGATIFKTAFLEFQATTNQNIASIKSNDQGTLIDKYVFYYITNLYDDLKSKMRNYGMLNLSTLREFVIPIPSHKEQERIVGILDKFESLTSSINRNLYSESSLRRKQYEYYRDFTLSFSGSREEVCVK